MATATFADIPKELAQRPDLDAALTEFVNHWGIEAYEPPEAVMGTVRQIVLLAIDASRGCAIAETPGVEGVNPQPVSAEAQGEEK